MKKVILTTVTTALLATSSFAFDPTKYVDTDKIYYGVGLGAEAVNDYDTGVALSLNAGVPLLDIDEKSTLGVEFEITQTVVPEEKTYYKTDADLSYTTFAPYAVYTYNLSSELFVRGRAALLTSLRHYSYGSYTSNTTDLSLALTSQVGYKFTDKISLIASAGMLNVDLFHFRIGAQFRF